MTEREIARSIDSDSGKTLRIVEVTGEYPGFRIQQLYEGVVQSQSHWDQRSFVDTVEEAQEEVRLIHLAAVEMRSLTREYIRFGYPAPNTPDGPSDYGHKYAEGLIKYNTPGHGYLWLSEELNAQIHPA